MRVCLGLYKISLAAAMKPTMSCNIPNNLASQQSSLCIPDSISPTYLVAQVASLLSSL